MKPKKQEECFSGTILLMLFVSAVLSAALFGLSAPILRILGAQEEILTLCVQYVHIIALGAVFQLMATGFVPLIRNMNGASFAMAAMIFGFVTNIALDYTCVWVLNWGMAGAALATIAGQAVTMAASIIFFVVKKCRLRFPAFGELGALWKDVLKVSLSPFGLTFSPTITMLFVNRFLLLYGDEKAVAVYGCISYITSIIYLLLQGVGDGSQPLLSHCYGERDAEAVKELRSLAYRTAAVITVVCMVGVYLARAKVGILFGASADANAGVVQYLPYFLATLPFLAFVRITTSYFYATEKTMLSYILVYAEPVCTLLLLLILPLAFKLIGVWLAVPLAQVVTFGIAWAKRKA